MDPIALELLRFRMEAICDAGCLAIQNTAISPIVAESKDYSCSILDREGALLHCGVRGSPRHGYAFTNAIGATLRRHGATIGPGDLFLVNDPHHGGGLHAQDVILLKPVFVDRELAAWIGCSAHMSDMGGMVAGSWCPEATECYQEALRLPPVRLVERGIERRDIWDVLLNNLRIPDIVEMDMRALVAGANVAEAELAQQIERSGIDGFRAGAQALCELVRDELRRRVSTLETGVYRAATWVDWDNERFAIPCALTIAEGRMIFDFEGAAPQAPHFFNSKRYIITSLLACELAAILGGDLPYNAGFISGFEVRCPRRSIVDSEPPAPVGAAHMDVGFGACEAATQSLMMAIAASADTPFRRFLAAPAVTSAYLYQTWAGTDPRGAPVGWLVIEGAGNGAAGAADRDGNDLGIISLGTHHRLEYPDVEIMEDWYPIRYEYKRPVAAGGGLGAHRSGGSLEAAYRRTGDAELRGTNLGNRQWVPFPGMAGGFPGATSASHILRACGEILPMDNHEQGFLLDEGDILVTRPGGGGGWGDPLDRDPKLVAHDVASGRLTAADACGSYGVVLGELAKTEALRSEMRRRRLASARPAERPFDSDVGRLGQHLGPLYPGVDQYGDVAVSAHSGARLARAPDPWTGGCPTLDDLLDLGPDVTARAYLDPRDGRILAMDVVVGAAGCSFESMPGRWCAAARMSNEPPARTAASAAHAPAEPAAKGGPPRR